MQSILKLVATIAVSSVDAAYDTSMLVPMSLFKSKYRTLSVWECFEAKGKFCTDRDHQSMILITGSSNRGHGICCSMDNEEDSFCNSEGDFVCSEPAEDIEPNNKWAAIKS